MSKKDKYFVTGIGTNVGKTLVSAILCEALKADYWKPVQCGNLDSSDSDFIRKNTSASVFDEAYELELPASPHLAALQENVTIELNEINLPETENNLIVEGAGGMLVPLNEKNLVIDIASKLDLKLIIVSAFYLGSINHTLLTLEVAKQMNLPIEWLIFSGEKDNSTEVIIHRFHPEIKIAFVPQLKMIDKNSIHQAANDFKNTFLK